MKTPALLLSCLAAGLAATPAPADDGTFVIDTLGVERGQVRAVLRLEGAFDADRRTSIERGLPITVRFTTELWRERRRWWDAQVDSRVRSYRVRWDPGERLFLLIPSNRRARAETYETLDALLEELARRVVDVHPRWELDDGNRYYVSAEAAIRPLTLEEFRELDGWISGRLRGGGGPEDGPAPPAEGEDEGSVPGALFDFLRKWAGFGDTILRARSPSFRPTELEELPAPP
jgi:hypothetical protein